MNTLQDFLLVTKAETYLIAVTLLLIFPLFWRWLNGKKENRIAGKDRSPLSKHLTRPSE